MDIPEWIDEEIVGSVGYWIITVGVWIGFLLGFKGAEGGLFGLTGDVGFGIPLWTQIVLMLVTPVISYIVYGRIMNR